MRDFLLLIILHCFYLLDYLMSNRRFLSFAKFQCVECVYFLSYQLICFLSMYSIGTCHKNQKREVYAFLAILLFISLSICLACFCFGKQRSIPHGNILYTHSNIFINRDFLHTLIMQNMHKVSKHLPSISELFDYGDYLARKLKNSTTTMF